MATAAVLSLLDEHTRHAAFDASLAKLKAAPHGIDINALDICLRLLPTHGTDGESEATSQHEQLWDIVLSRLVGESSSNHLYTVAELCLNHESPVTAPFKNRLYAALSQKERDLSSGNLEALEAAKNYLHFLKCCFWVPGAQEHLVDTETLGFLSSFLGIDGLDEAVHETLSAFFSLLKNSRRATSSIQLDQTVNETLWTRLSTLDVKHFAARSSNIYRTWFQWISLAASSGLVFQCVKDEQYWKKLRLGLVKGHADQRKYCLGIIRQSLLATTDHIDTPTIQYAATNVDRENYDLYSTLFETIVLHRYTGQVEDSLSSMTRLLGSSNALPSRITPAMTTTLLTAALDPLIQESVRKTIGRWYMDFVIQRRGDISGDIHFLFDGFLPWATDGSLFTSTLTATRTRTVCAHGEALATVISRFAADTEDSPCFVPSNDYGAQEVGVDNRRGRAILLGVVRFIMNARGRLFQPAILYLMDGLITGLTARYEKSPTDHKFESSDVAEILSLARLPGLPEVTSDLHGIHCQKLCNLIHPDTRSELLPAEESLRARCKNLEQQVDQSTPIPTANIDQPLSLQLFLQNLHESKHSCIQGQAFAPACKALVKLLDQMDASSANPDEVHTALAALWEEAEIRDFIRPFAVHIPPLMFHLTCINICVAHHQKDDETAAIDLTTLLSKAMARLTRLSKGRSYVLATLARSLRKAAFANPSITSILPFEEYILDFVNDPASIKPEFLFEVVAAERLQRFLPHRTYTSYYGLREWHAYTAVLDILRRFPDGQLNVARSILNRLLQPWRDQQPPVAVKSPWKQTLQLQAMLILSHFCITQSDANMYLDGLTHALTLESWPRYRYLLEWTIARIYHQFPGESSRIIKQLQNLDEYRPMHIASLIKLGLLVAPYESKDFAARLMMELNAYSASPKVQIRHEANFAFPLVFDLATEKGWKSIIENPALKAMNAFIRRLDKFSASPWTIRTLRVDIETEFTMVGIFQGRYLSIESPEDEPVTYDDFKQIELDDQAAHVACPPARVQLGTAPEGQSASDKPASTPRQAASTEDQTGQITLQTKAGIDLDNLHPVSGPPSTRNQRPASVMLIASLIDNPTNLGGLSRISESFGLEALYIDDLKKVAHKDFKATSVRSEKHLAIKELKEVDVPTFLLEAKSQGYEVVGIEQTDRSGILGYEGVDGAYIGDSGDTIEVVRHQDIGTLPRKCCLVLGSEKEGISAEVLAVIDRNVEIKTVGVTRSLNVQTAGGIALYEWWREWGQGTS